MEYQIHTLHRGKFIWILLGGLFLIGIVLSWLQMQEILKIITLLCCIPFIMYGAVKFNQQSSTWTFTDDTLFITRANKTTQIPLKEIAYIKNHTRSGGNLIAFHFQSKTTTKRFWRNKLFVSVDQFDQLTQTLKEKQIEIISG